MTDVVTECRALGDARKHPFDEEHLTKVLLEKPAKAINYRRDTGLSKAGRV